jgi:hypothetical protein
LNDNPTNKEVDDDVLSYFTRRGYYANGFFFFSVTLVSNLFMIASKLCSWSNDNTSYIITEPSKKK